MPWSDAFIASQQTADRQPVAGRELSYIEALNEALTLALALDPNVFVLGQGVDDPSSMFGVTQGLAEQFGAPRVFDTPLSEEGLTGICTGAAMHGLRPVYCHNRPDFLLLAFNQIVNHASKTHYMDNGQTKVPLVIWSAIGRGWGSGAQHSQAIQGLLMSVPGLKIVMPSTPYDAKGLMLAAIADNNPVLIFEHRWLMKQHGAVPEGIYEVPIGKGVYRERGSDLSIIGFLLLAFNQIVNHASKTHYMDNGQTKVPLVIWSAIGRGWGSGAQHSQAIQGLLMSVPGLKIVMPSTPYDAKGLMLAAIADNNPVLIFEHRWLMKQHGAVPEGIYEVPIGKGVYRERGSDLSIIGSSHTLALAQQALGALKAQGISADVVDLRTLKPLDHEIILESVKKTGRVLIVDTGWAIGGVCAEVACVIAENCPQSLKAPIKRVGLPDLPTPAGDTLEQYYYPSQQTMSAAILELLEA